MRELARAGELTGTECRILATVAAGEVLDLRVGDPERDDSSNGGAWDEARSVRAEFLYALCVGAHDEWRMHARGLRLCGARITGELNLEAASVAFPLTFRDCYFDEPLVLSLAHLVTLRLPGCHLPDIAADQLEARGNVEFNDGFHADGEVCLAGAHIGGRLDCAGGTFTNPGGRALTADQLTVKQGMFCRDGFHAHGEVRLISGHIGGTLDCAGGTSTHPYGYALNGYGLTAENMYCTNGFHAQGEVSLFGARIGGVLAFDRASPSTLAAPRSTASKSSPSEVQELRQRVALKGTVDLTHARVGLLIDAEESWPVALRLDGFVYDSIRANPEVSVEQRLGWLARDPDGYSPQKYEQLAAVYRKAGHEQEARQVAIAKQCARRQQLPRPARLWNRLLGVTVGYGYEPWRAVWWLLGFVAVGALLFAKAYPEAMTVTAPAGQLPVFQPVIYALDVLLPVVDLRQQDFWIPNATRPWGWLYLGWFWLSIGAGLVLTTAVAAAVTGLLKTD